MKDTCGLLGGKGKGDVEGENEADDGILVVGSYEGEGLIIRCIMGTDR